MEVSVDIADRSNFRDWNVTFMQPERAGIHLLLNLIVKCLLNFLFVSMIVEK